MRSARSALTARIQPTERRRSRRRRRRRKKTPRAERLVALGLGANQGDPEQHICTAIEALGELLGELRVSPLFRTEPLSEVAQPEFWNAAVTGLTALSAPELLAVAKALEWAAGRRPGPRFGPRPLDIDLLLHGAMVVSTPELQIPHPRLAERRFYLEPLARIAPRLQVPPESRTVEELLARAPTDQGVREAAWKVPPAAFEVVG